MSDNRGQAFLLKLANESVDPPSYATIAGLKAKQITINGEAVAKEDHRGWRTLVSGAGTRSVIISAEGIFTGTTSETQFRHIALDGRVEPFDLSFESGERLRAKFLPTMLEYIGDYNGERNYRIALESSGEVTVL
jgi:predicted secreted protein